MSFFNNLRIRQKIITIIFSINLLITVIGIAISLIVSLYDNKTDLVRSNLNYMRVIEESLYVQLINNNADKIPEVLKQLSVIPEIENAIVYDENKKNIASYNRHDSVFSKMPFQTRTNNIFEKGYLQIYDPILKNNRLNGFLYLRVSTLGLEEKIYERHCIIGISIIVLLIISYFLAKWAEKTLTAPLIHLTETAGIITANNDYTLRLQKKNKDEIGQLYDSFNKMLDQVQKQEQERLMVLEELKDSERQLVEIINAVPHAIFIKDLQGRFLMVNKAFAALYNETPEKLIGVLQTSFHSSSEDIEKFLKDDEKVILQKESIFTPEQKFIDVLGKQKFLTTIKQPFLHHKIECVLGVSVDITEEKNAKEAMKESQELFSSFMNVLPAGAFVKNEESVYLYVNEYLKNLFGAESWIGKDFNSLHSKYIAEKLILEDKIAQHKPLSVEESKIDRFSNIRFYETLKFPIKREGKSSLIGGIAIDITKRKEAEERIKYYIEELKRNNQELEEFNYVASHDLREPLRTLTSFCELLREDMGTELTVEAKENIDFIVDAASRLNTLILDILQLSRLGRVELKMVTINLNDCLNTIVKDLQLIIKETKGNIIWNDLPSVKGDATQLIRVLQNLINNALKFHGEKPPIIQVTAKELPEKWEITISDNGIGIKKQYLEQIFLPFKRLHSRDKYEGTGIGLAICRKIIKRHNGEIYAESIEGEGTSFKFTLDKVV